MKNVGEKITRLSKKFDLNYELKFLVYREEYQYLYGEDLTLDDTIIVQGDILEAINLAVSKEDYILLMRFLISNFMHDDGCDQFFIYDYNQIKNMF